MTKKWIKRIYAVEFLHYNVYNKIKAIPGKDCACIVQYDEKMSARHVQNPINGFCAVLPKNNEVMLMKISENCYKLENTANPISPNVFCADPTGVEYNGRLYIYGTNDHQEYEAVGDDGKNGYAHIKSIVMLSTDDMVNWEYHGFIDVEKLRLG